jgi:hypothetical protein
MGRRKKIMQEMVTQVNNNSNGKGNVLSPAPQTSSPDFSDITKFELIEDGGRGLNAVVKDKESGKHYNPNFGYELKADTIYHPFKPEEVIDIEWKQK